MSGSVSSSDETTKKLSVHFGLYKQNMDERTEQFLKLSKARQIKLGLICAAASTAITVGIVVAILMVYDYAIAVESSIVQTKYSSPTISEEKYNDNSLAPIADKLDSGHVFFDQETFEKIPFLINDLKSVDYEDSGIENGNNDFDNEITSATDSNRESRMKLRHKYGLYWSSIRRTSPRPFIFEYKDPTPSPFKKPKQISTRSWLSDYRQSQKLKNIEHIISYLKNTVKVQVGDLVASSKKSLNKVSGVYVQSENEEKNHNNDEDMAASALTERLAEAVAKKTNNNLYVKGQPYHADPLHLFKPEHPSDVNLLVDPTLRSSTILRTNNHEHTTLPKFRALRYPFFAKKKYHVHDYDSLSKPRPSSASKDKSKLLSVMLDIYPTEEKDEATNEFRDTIIPLSVPNFRPKPTIPTNAFGVVPTAPFNTQLYRPFTLRPMYYPPLRPYYNPLDLGHKSINFHPYYMHSNVSRPNKMMFHLNFHPTKSTPPYDQNEIRKIRNSYFHTTTTTPEISTATPIPIPISYPTTDEIMSQVTTEEYNRPTIDSFLNRYRIINDIQAWTSPQPDVIKFNREDAKVPDDYHMPFQRKYEIEEIVERRKIGNIEVEEMEDQYKDESENPNTEETTINSTPLTIHIEEIAIPTNIVNAEMLDPFSKRDLTTSSISTSEPSSSIEPQINGHYRSINRNSQQVNAWMNEKKSVVEAASATIGKTYKIIERNVRKPSS